MLNRPTDEIQDFPRSEDDAFQRLGVTDWDGYFKGFAPGQRYYYLQGMAVQVLTAYVLNGFTAYPFMQSILMLCIAFFEFQSVLFTAPYLELAASREELVNKAGRFLTYLLVLFSFKGTLGLDVS